MLSFNSSIQKSADLKTQPSTVNLVEQNKCTPDNIWRLNFQRPLLIVHPLQKHFEGAEDVDGVPLGTCKGAISKIKKKQTFGPIFFFIYILSFFQWPLLLHPLQNT